MPNVGDLASFEDIERWQRSEPKEYKLKILDLTADLADELCIIDPSGKKQGEKTWRDMDGSVLKFRSSCRPRARYLYWHYCLQVLRYTWREHSRKSKFGPGGEVILKQEIAKKQLFWGTPGRYLPKNMLLAFVQELGHEFEYLLKGAGDDAEGTVDVQDVLLGVAANQIKRGSLKDIEGWQEDVGYDGDEEY